MEMIGIIAFAVVGVLVGIYYELDIFGIYVEGVISCIGGGVIRDLVLGITPPTSFVYPVYIVASMITITAAIIIFKIFDTKIKRKEIHLVKKFIMYFDAIGLGVFTAVGCSIACKAGYANNIFIIIFVGMSTAIGGGLMRDLLAGRKPVVMRKDIYATISIFGSVVYFLLFKYTSEMIALYVTAFVTVISRVGVMHIHGSMPYHIRNKALRTDEDLEGNFTEEDDEQTDTDENTDGGSATKDGSKH